MKQTLLFYSLLLCFCGSTGVIPSSAQRIALRSSEQLQARSDRHANYVPPTRTVAEKRSPRRGGGGGDGGGSSGGSGGGSGGSGSGSGGSSCTPTTEVTLDRSPGAGSQISRGYGTHTSEGPGARNSIEGGWTRNGTGTQPTILYTNGTWEFGYFTKLNDSGFYWGGAEVPYTAGEESPNGIVPKLTSIDYGDRYLRIYDENDYPKPYRDCQWPELLYIYPYPVEFNYSEVRYNVDAADYVNTTFPVTAVCCCLPESVCGCDYPSAPSFVQAQGDRHVDWEDQKDTDIFNYTGVCYFPMNGRRTLFINGTLERGSTKANYSIPEPEPPMITRVITCDTSKAPMYAAPHNPMMLFIFPVVMAVATIAWFMILI